MRNEGNSLVDLVGIEPTTSSMPWKLRIRKLLTDRWFKIGKIGKTGGIGPF
jgi:hypothetical protein